MKYDFETRVDRKNRGNIKEMWFTPEVIRKKGVPSYSGAEFEFRTAEPVIRAVQEAAGNGLFGFTVADDNYREHLVWWLREVRGVTIDPSWILPVQGTIFSVATSIRIFCGQEEGMVVMTPDYNRYDQAARRLKRRKTAFSPMKLTEEGRFVPDFEDLERKFADPKTKLMVLCNPNNPTGQVLGEETLQKILELSRKYQVAVLSDEIFSDISLNGKKTPCLAEMAEEGDLVISTVSMGKTFSFTGVNSANVIIRNPVLRERYQEQRDADHFGSIDPMAFAAYLGGYTEEGKEWLGELISVLQTNTGLFTEFFESVPGIRVYHPDAGYVMWVDFSGLGMKPEDLAGFLTNEAFFCCDPGEEYYGEGCEMRICTAVPTKNVKENIELLREAFAKKGLL